MKMNILGLEFCVLPTTLDHTPYFPGKILGHLVQEGGQETSQRAQVDGRDRTMGQQNTLFSTAESIFLC